MHLVHVLKEIKNHMPRFKRPEIFIGFGYPFKRILDHCDNVVQLAFTWGVGKHLLFEPWVGMKAIVYI